MKRMLAEQNEQLKEYSENLEKMVREKTAELVQAYERLNSLDANKMYFLVYLAQEMDSPLDRIQCLAEVLLNYFAFAGAEITAHHEPVRLRDAVDAAVQEKRERIGRRDLSLTVEIDPAVTVLTDRVHLAEVLAILLDNAVCFSQDGGRITVSSSPEPGRVQLRVTDTGQGIPEQNLRNIFKPFMLDRSQRHPNGFGLSLPRARSIIHALDGRLWAESEGPGKGATFCVELPAG